MKTLTNHYNLPLSMAVFLAADDYDGPQSEEGVKTISATSLLKSTRQIVLGFRLPEETFTDVSDLISSRMGQAFHTAVEHAWLFNSEKSLEALGYPKKVRDAIVINPEPGTDLKNKIPVYLEQRAEKKLAGWVISGKFDLIVNGVLEDVKSTSTYSYEKQTNKEKYSQQGSIYKWLNPDLISSDYTQINYIFTDWSARYVKTKPDYPPLKIYSQKIPLMQLQQTEQFIKTKLREIDKYLEADESEIPLCNEQDLWRSEPKYQYWSNPNNKQATKNFDNLLDANNYLVTKGKGVVIKKEGEVKACKYCSVFNLCSQKDQLIESGELKL